MSIQDKYDHKKIEAECLKKWEALGVYKFQDQSNKEVFSIDTPPPTVSGSLHVGHVFSYTQTDILARYHRMQGKNVFYPMGWDDNGLPTERRVQNVFEITCNPHLPYQANWTPTLANKESKREEVSRQNFIEACEVLTQKDEEAFESMWRQLGLSVDWDIQYESINAHSRKMSQASFLDLVQKGYVYQHEAPTMWDVDFQTAVAQAEIEDRNCQGAYHHLAFGVEGGGQLVIATTRPELLPACIAVVAHPEDERYKPLFGKKALTPLFEVAVPILPSTHADPEKGTGILMVCTFGDANDVEWWKQSGLPARSVLGQNGRFKPLTFQKEALFSSQNPTKANAIYAQIQGLKVPQARKVIVALLEEPTSAVGAQGPALVRSPESIEHPVKFFEKGESPIEFMTTRQWFVKILEHKAALLAQGEKIVWHPEYMKARYTSWVEGLNQDWCISRQRFFGVPFPVWYPLDAAGNPNFEAPIFAGDDQLPIDPMSTAPHGYQETQRNKPNGFIGDPDVMDTWATSSLTPQIALGLKFEESISTQLPMTIRPQSHEIIRTWAFYTITKAWMHAQKIPWKNVLISGWVLDPDRKKMSKSKGNVVTPAHLLEAYSSDAVRYWAAKARLGTDTAFDESMFAIGKKLVNKLYNAAKFVMSQIESAGTKEGLSQSDIVEPLDQVWVHHMTKVVGEASLHFEKFEYAAALDKIETSFWKFCDYYIELVKGRAYQETGSKQRSALAALDWSAQLFLKLFAPFIPFITEEIWAWRYLDVAPSVHQAKWPTPTGVVMKEDLKSPELLVEIMSVLSEIRGAKTQAQKSMKHPVERLEWRLPQGIKDSLCEHPRLLEDLKRAGGVATVSLSVSTEETSGSEIQLSSTLT